MKPMSFPTIGLFGWRGRQQVTKCGKIKDTSQHILFVEYNGFEMFSVVKAVDPPLKLELLYTFKIKSRK